MRSTQPVTYDKTNDVAVALRFLLQRRGIGTSNIAEAGGFVRSRHATDARCDLQFHFVPALLDEHGTHRLDGYGYTLHACALRPKSRGTIRLASADPAAHAAIRAELSRRRRRLRPEAPDRRRAHLARNLRAGAVRRRTAARKSFRVRRRETDADLETFIRRKAETIYHPVGTCRMGHDALAVVDSELRVRGIENLRVVDASIMPTLIGGNTNAPTMMIAERAGDLLNST